MTTLPADAHVHSEFSWDAGSHPAAPGTMARASARAVELGLRAIVFTEHLDLDDPWLVDGPEDIGGTAGRYAGDDGVVRLPALDLDGYLDSIERCRHAHPGLRIVTGVEYGQPHVHDAVAAPLLRAHGIERVNGSLHTLPWRGGRAEPATLYRHLAPDDVMTAYLEELPRMIAGSDSFQVLTHIDFAARTWPADATPFDPRRFEEGFRAAMRALAESGRALEMNTRTLAPWLPRWWADEGGRAVSFGSDAHAAEGVAHGFGGAAALLEATGFRPGTRPEDLWVR